VALRASVERFRTLSVAAFDGVFLHAEGKIVLANDAGSKMYGFEPGEIVGVPVMELTAPESRASVTEHVRSGSTEAYEGVARRKDGSTFVAEVHGTTLVHQGRPMRVTIIRDVTDRRRALDERDALAERVRQAQKLESLGVLAGGVAHDFNNILMVVANCVSLARREEEQGRSTKPDLDTIARAVERAADLCRQMLAYAGKASIAREAVDLSALVGDMAGMLEVSVAKRAMFVRELAVGLPPLLGDATQVRQVVMNLVINAAEAIARPDGTVRVTTGVKTIEPGAFARFAAGADAPPGSYVFVEVQDEGIGMDAPTVAQMFDPFFSTKFVGRGLGMAAVMGIVRGHSGAIEVESRPGEGTRIRVYFPVAAAQPKAPPAPVADAPHGEGVVLVVDDEKNVRVSTQLLLRELGYEALVARDGFEAIEVLRTEGARIGAVLLDLTMPRMDGRATLRELRKLSPDVPVVLTSGYGEMPLGGDTGPAPDAVLPKPYTADRLVTTLRQVMRRA
jgi:PAS domain S-box-containing protein